MRIRRQIRQAKFVSALVIFLIAALALTYFAFQAPTSLTANAAALNPCTITYANGAPQNVSIAVVSGSDAMICVSYYYYNSTNTAIFIPQNQIKILGYQAVPNSNATRLIDDTSFFSIQSRIVGSNSTSSVQIGGPGQLNEGIIVAYTISSNTATPNGIYFVSFNAVQYPQNSYCRSNVELVSGNYAYQPAGLGCIHMHATSLTSNGFINGLLTAKVIGTSNSRP